VTTFPQPADPDREPIVRHVSGILLLAVGLVVAACGEEDRMGPAADGPHPDGTLAVSTSTRGADPDRDGYVLAVDGKMNIPLAPSGTKDIRLAFGPHRLELLGVAGQCAIAQGDARFVEVPSQATIAITFEVHCPPAPPGTPGAFRITVRTTGSVSESTRYSGWYTHFGAWDYGGDWALLGAVAPNGALIAEMEPSSEGGGDPYWYDFELRDLPGNCSVNDPTPDGVIGYGGVLGFSVFPGDRVDVEFAVSCSP